MKNVVTILRIGMILGLSTLFACSPEPTTKEECIIKYSAGVKTDSSKQQIVKACTWIFSGNTIDKEYYKCILDEVPDANNDKEVNTIVRKCRMENL